MRRLALPAAALLAWTAGSAVSVSAYRSSFPPPSEIRSPAAGAASDMLALALGARRLFADVWFIRLMQYYGSSELSHDDGDGDEDPRFEWLKPGERGHHHDHAELNGGGRYPEFLALARHVLEIDPGFAAAALYGAGSLAFNLNRPEEAVELLEYALKYSPREWRYLNVLAAIGYSRQGGDPAAVAASLAPLLKDPDCPAMLKQQAAFLNKKLGNYPAAAAIYADIAATSRDPFYVRNAERQLEALAKTPLSGAPGRRRAR